MAEPSLWRIGSKQRLAYLIDAADEELRVMTVASYILAADGVTYAVNGSAGGVSTDQPASQIEVYYLWDTTSAVAGDYTAWLRYSLEDGRVIDVPEEEPWAMTLISPGSHFDRWVTRVNEWLAMATGGGSAPQIVSWRMKRDAILAAVRRYSEVRPRLRQAEVPLSAGVWEYPLPADFLAGASYFRSLEYPVDPSSQYYPVLDYLDEYAYDATRGVWFFRKCFSPSEGQTARLTYAALHTLTDTEDTVPAQHFHDVAQYAASLVLQQMAARFAQLGDGQVGDQVVDYRTKEQQTRAVSAEYRQAAMRAWGPRDPVLV